MHTLTSRVFGEQEQLEFLETSGLESKFIEIEPGLIACIDSSSRTIESNRNSIVPGDNEFIHLNCMLRGKFSARVRGVPLDCHAGDIIMGFCDGEVFHTDHCEDFLNLALMVKPQVLYDLAGEELVGLNLDKNIEFFLKSGRRCQRVLASASRIVSLMQQRPQPSLLLHSAVLDCLYWQLNAIQGNTNGEYLSSRERKQLTVAKDCLLSDLSSPPTIAKLASTVGMNQCKLKRGFRILFGKSIYAYFQEKRMRKAMDLLKNHNVTETAVTLGYSNISHFSVAFRKQFGVLPKEAQRELEPDINLSSFKDADHRGLAYAGSQLVSVLS